MLSDERVFQQEHGPALEVLAELDAEERDRDEALYGDARAIDEVEKAQLENQLNQRYRIESDHRAALEAQEDLQMEQDVQRENRERAMDDQDRQINIPRSSNGKL